MSSVRFSPSGRAWATAGVVLVAGVITFVVMVLGAGPILGVVLGLVAGLVGWWYAGSRAFVGAAVASVAVAAPFWFSAFNLSQILVLAVGALGLVLLSGQTGQISVAQGSMVGVGAYTTAVLVVNYSVPPFLTLPCAVVAAAIVGLLVGIPTSRLRGIYQVITTLAVGVAFPQIIVVIGDPVGGSTGIPVANPFDFTITFGDSLSFDPERLMYVVALVALVLTWVVLGRIVGSRHGTAMRAIRQNEVVAVVNGIRVGRYRVLAFTFSAAVAGLAGSLYALTVGAVSPESFGLLYSIQFLVAIALGGSNHLAGALAGAVAAFVLTTELNGIPIPGTTLTLNSEVLYGIAVILVLLLLRGGIWGAITDGIDWLARRIRGTPAGHREPEATPSDRDGPSDMDSASIASPASPAAAPSRPHLELEEK